MRKVYNFNPGPAMLPEEVLLQAQAEMLDWNGTGMSVMEIGHRSSEFKEIAEQTELDLRELMEIPNHYQVLFCAGGATPHFAMVPLNLFTEKHTTADYLDTGIWSKKAIDEASRYGQINIAAKVHIKQDLVIIPPEERWSLNPKATYVHYTPNETIEGVQFHFVPQTGEVPLVADMTSMLLSQPIDVSKYGVIYAGAQKNLSQAGISVVIIREDLIKQPLPNTPTLYTYKTYSEHKSFYNTPPTYAWYLAGLVLRWMKKNGGVKAFAVINQRKAEKLYQFIDQHPEFYSNNIHPSYRSLMNVPFNLHNDELTKLFLDSAAKAGFVNLKGHRLAGGVRVSMYNAMPETAIDSLIDFMKNFANKIN